MKHFQLPLMPKFVVVILIAIISYSCKKEEVQKINKSEPPSISSSVIFSLGSNAVTILSNIKKDECIEILTQGVEWNLKDDPSYIYVTEISIVDSTFYCRIENLSPNKEYIARSFIRYDDEIMYGKEIEFTTNDILTDIEGNVYNTVTIGNQVWMEENFKSTKYNNGSDIFAIDDNTDWQLIDSLNIPGYFWYDYNTDNKDQHGAFYNWPIIESEKLCPKGWHIPTDDEWLELINFLGGEMVAGSFLKERLDVWITSDYTQPNNFSGFSAYASGRQTTLQGNFSGMREYSSWWTSTVEKSPNDSYNYFVIARGMNYLNSFVERQRSMQKAGGIVFASLRCIKD